MRADLKQTAKKAQVQGDPPEVSPGPIASVSDQLKPGRLFACFELQRELEIGSTGAVWLAQNYSVKRQSNEVALKFLPEFIVHNKTALEDLKDQIRRRIPLQHPNIQRVYDLAESNGRVAVQLEYLDGQSLSNLRSAKPNQVFEVRDLEKWAGELCGALEYAHQEVGLTDIDLVPGNLIIDPAGNLKVKDAGIANCIADSMSRLIAVEEPVKILPYQSSRRAAGEKPAVTDNLYSLGALLYELLTSKPPFDSQSTGAQVGEKLPSSMSQRRAELGIVGEAIPENWEETVAACLAKDPYHRPQTASEVEKRLKNTTFPIPNPESPVHTPSPRKKWLTIAVLILILAVGSAAAFLALHRLSEPKRVNPVKEPSHTLLSSPSDSTGKEDFLPAGTSSPEVRPTPSPAPAVSPASSPEVRPTPSPAPVVSPANSPEVRPTPSPAPAVSPSTSPEVHPTPSPALSPTLSDEARPAPSPIVSSPTSPELSPTPSPRESPTTSPGETATPSGRQSAGPSPASLNQHDIDATKEEVIKRINALPGVTAEKRANLIEKMHKARSMERLTVIPFDVRQAALRRTAVDDLLKTFALPEMRDKLSDPTTILVVAGYADTGGRADANLRISQERAENISRILKEQAKLPNAIQTIGMGGTELLDSQRPGENRAVEVWAVVPF
jgi:outer membrane protein OmpA-like peptidoglycan-associated protein